jgi:hypothetical protein
MAMGADRLPRVIATGNHFVADIVAGVAVTAVGFLFGRAASQFAAGERRGAPPVPAMATSG